MDGNSLLASLLVSSIGFVLFVYGKRMSRPPQLLVGLILLVYSYFVSSVWLMFVIAALLVGVLWLLLRLGW